MKKQPSRTVSPVTEEQQRSLPEDVKALQAEVDRLRKELHQEKLRADAYDMMITIAEGAFNIPIRKKSGAER